MMMGLNLKYAFLTESRDARAVRVGYLGRPLVTRGLLLVLYSCLLDFCAVSPSASLHRLFILSSIFRVLWTLWFSPFCGAAAAPLSLYRFHRGGAPSFGSSAPASGNNLSDRRSSSDPANEVPSYSLSSYIPKIEIDRFDGKSDFVMWRRKMKAVLVQNKIALAICSPEEYPESWTGEILKEKLGLTGENLLVIALKVVPNQERKAKKNVFIGKEGNMKNKCFKRIKEEKQRKHSKGVNKVDTTHVF
ncbi:hypothetical protein M9H77_08353 [Catharanthus roseus]|uniref:Uncharacterized protein n=1 Tax=Catharanthus roseus TaxID=4058 RepID=A0ACC0BXT4_CATRO|nr:hypothetical protein M9H77_08353 [Catharanthus roseus]